MTISTEMCGILLMIASGFCVTSDMVTSRIIKESGWPYWYLISGTCCIAAVTNAIFLYFCGSNWPKATDLKWVLARAFLESLHWHSTVLAVILGTSPGDVAALTSVDIIAAAFFGLIFLGEKISLLHFVALALSAVGAIFISQPGFIFGQKQQNLLGSFLALLSGFFQAASFICARKSAHISVAVLTFSSLLLAVFMSLMPPLLPMVHAAKWQIVVAEPWKAMSLVLILLVLSTLSIALPAAGATRCPAAVSATVFTSSCMVSGYVSQIIFFKEVPGILTLLGAASMLFSVVLMALPALPEKSPAPADGSAVTSVDDLSRGRSFDSFDSLGSFVASEVSFNSTLSTLRRRETFQMMEIAEQIGAAMPVAST